MTTGSRRVIQRVKFDRDSHQARKLSVIFAAAILAVATMSVAAVGATGGFGSSNVTKSGPAVSSSHPDGHLIGRWITPRDESSAPPVPSSGGAVQGQGSFNGVSCPTSNECVAVGADAELNGVVSVSQNQGGTWTQGVLDQNEPELNAVDCESISVCVAVGAGVTVKSTDGGQTWTSSTIPTANTALLGVSCPTSTICVSVGVSPGENGPFAGQLLVSSDGGSTWSVPSLPSNFGALGSVSCPTATFCVAVGASILESNDGGQTWTMSTVNGGTGVLRSVSCESATTCVAVGGNPAVSQVASAAAYEVVTTDGGEQWAPKSMPSGSGTVNTVSCSSSACVVVGSAHGAAALQVLTTASGASWTPETSIASAATAVSALSCYSSTSCVFVGLDGNQQVSVSTVNGSPVGSSPVASQVRSQNDEVH
jgi:photosystem II stability/assembly factor-like uncharacterized protein